MEFSQNKNLKLSAERFGQVRRAVAGAREEMAREGLKDDGGERRRRAEEKLAQEPVDRETAERTRERILNKYIDVWHIGAPEIRGSLEAVHAAVPSRGMILRYIKNKRADLLQDESFEDLYAKIGEIEGELEDWIQEHKEPEFDLDEKEFHWCEPILPHAVKALKKKYTDGGKLIDKLAVDILNFKNKVDDKTGEIVRAGAEVADISHSISRQPRLLVDMNRATDVSSKALEFNTGARAAQWYVFDKFTERFKEGNKLVVPFLQIEVHGKSNKDEDFVIGGKITAGKVFCDPAISQWLKDKLEKKIRKYDLSVVGKNGERRLATVKVAIEGEKYCGDHNLYSFRYGEGGKAGLGELLQTAQIEIDGKVRSGQTDLVGRMLAEVLADFSAEFKGAESLKKYIVENTSAEDRNRLNGIYKVKTVQDDRIKSGKVGLSGVWRDVLGAKVGDDMRVGKKMFRVVKVPKDLVNTEGAVFSPQDEVVERVEMKVKNQKPPRAADSE